MSKVASTFHPTNLACIVVILTFFPIEIGLVFFFFLIDCNNLEVLGQYSLFFSEKYPEKRH